MYLLYENSTHVLIAKEIFFLLKAWSLKFVLRVKFMKNFNNRFITIGKQASCIAARDYVAFGNKYESRIFGTSITSLKMSRTYIWTSTFISQDSPGKGTVSKNTGEIILLSLGKSKYSYFLHRRPFFS